MIGFVLRLFAGPATSLLGIGAVLVALCGCMSWLKCRGCKLRDMACMKWCFRATGVDMFDEFELLVQVHEVAFEARNTPKTFVRLSAGRQVVATAKNKKGIFQEVVSVFVEQGTEYLVVDLYTESKALLANLKLHIINDIINLPPHAGSKTYHMTQKDRGVLNPSITLTLHASHDEEMEVGLLAGEDMETAFLMKNHLSQAQHEVMSSKNSNVAHMQSGMQSSVVSDAISAEEAEMLDVLVKACCGPLEVFSGFGSSNKMNLHVLGPPATRRFILGFWKDQRDIEAGKDAQQEVDVLKIQGVMADPGQQDVFLVSYYDKQQVSRKLRCRIIDRPTKVWVETLTLLITRVHSLHKSLKHARNEKERAVKREAVNKARSFQSPTKPPAKSALVPNAAKKRLGGQR